MSTDRNQQTWQTAACFIINDSFESNWSISAVQNPRTGNVPRLNRTHPPLSHTLIAPFVMPGPLSRQAAEVHPAEDAAGCHGSSAGTRGCGAGLHLRMSPGECQHPRGELRPRRVGLHHHMWRTLLPRGNVPSYSWSGRGRMWMCVVVVTWWRRLTAVGGCCVWWMLFVARIRSSSTTTTGTNRCVSLTGRTRWNTSTAVQWESPTRWPDSASAACVTKTTHSVAACLEASPAARPFKRPCHRSSGPPRPWCGYGNKKQCDGMGLFLTV